MHRKRRKAQADTYESTVIAVDAFLKNVAGASKVDISSLIERAVVVDAVDISTADVMTLGAHSGEAIDGAFVKFAPVLAAAERGVFDAEAVKKAAIDAGARAVVVAPTFEAEEKGPVPHRAGGRIDPREELRAWFSPRGNDSDAASALEACLRIADEVGL